MNVFNVSFLPAELTGEPEIVAMLQAFYSRSHVAITDRVETLGDTADKIREALKSYYIGYGHASIGDCGYVPIFFENVSILFAKALQDCVLYNGQETSSRYIDFTKQPCVSPFPHLSQLQANLLSFVERATPVVIEHIKACNPQMGESDAVYHRTAAARAFDILRGYLPAGACTNLSGIFSLRKWREHLIFLKGHPLREVSTIARYTLRELHARFPSSFKEEDHDAETVDCNVEHYYQEVYKPVPFDFLGPKGEDYVLYRDKFEPLPKRLAITRVHAAFDIDFGSFRDIQRHRNGVCYMPPILFEGKYLTPATVSSRMETWYIDSLPKELQAEATNLLVDTYNAVGDTWINPEVNQYDLQYYMPLATLVHAFFDYPLTNAVYICELRTSQTVHATLRKHMQKVAEYMEEQFPALQIHWDNSKETWNTKRGIQTILKKENA